MPELFIKSGYGANTEEPFVSLHYSDTVIQVSPPKAREIALMLLESAEAAEQDCFLMEWAQAETKVDERGAAMLLNEFRLWRKRRKTNWEDTE